MFQWVKLYNSLIRPKIESDGENCLEKFEVLQRPMIQVKRAKSARISLNQAIISIHLFKTSIMTQGFELVGRF